MVELSPSWHRRAIDNGDGVRVAWIRLTGGKKTVGPGKSWVLYGRQSLISVAIIVSRRRRRRRGQGKAEVRTMSEQVQK